MSLLVNGQAYGWASIAAKFPFDDVVVQSIEYDDEQEKEIIYGRGNLPCGHGTGNYKANCKMSFLLDHWERVENYCKESGISLYDLRIPKIIVSYADDGELTRIDEITDVGLTKISHKGAQGDKNLTVEVETIVSGMIIRNGVKPMKKR